MAIKVLGIVFLVLLGVYAVLSIVSFVRGILARKKKLRANTSEDDSAESLSEQQDAVDGDNAVGHQD